MEQEKTWGIAMEGCSEYIKEALLTACYNYNLDFTNKKGGEIFHYIEIGIAEGKTIARVCDYLSEVIGKEFIKVTAVDIEDGWSLNLENYVNNIIGYEKNIETTLEGSPLALKKIKDSSVNAIMIDGDHSLEAVKADFAEADRIIKKGGVIMFHDSDPFSQSKDDSENQKHGIEVREAIMGIDMEKYQLLTDYKPEEEEGVRGIYIIQRIFE